MDSVLEFKKSEPLTLGVEIEVQLLDKDGLDLKPFSPTVLEALRVAGGTQGRVKAEIFQSMVELNTAVCANAHEIRRDLGATIGLMVHVGQLLGLRLASSGTHPFAQYSDRAIFPSARYVDLIDRNQWIARRLMIFGLHVHVGMRSGEHAIQMNNALLHYLPLFLSLSASSPFCHGEDTELASSRITFFEAIPTGGHPCRVANWNEFVDLYSRMVKSDAVRSMKDIWWDVRPSPGYGTLEIRICDGLPTLEETVSLTAFIHALCIYIDRQLAKGRTFAPPPVWIMRENKWRASRWGLDARLILNEEGHSVDVRSLVPELVKEIQPIIEEQSYQTEMALIDELLYKGASYLRQRQIYNQSGKDLKAVTEFLAREFEAKAPIWN